MTPLFSVPFAVVAFAATALLGLYRLLQIGKRDPRMPKGPKTIPILGNLHQIPPTGLFKQFRQWSKEYGPIFTLKFGPSNVVVLCDREAVHQLLDKKGAIYSDRPYGYVGHVLTQGDQVVLSQMDASWRTKRKVIAHNFSPKQLDEKHCQVQEAEATVLLNDLLVNPDGFYNHVRRYNASVFNIIIWGHRGPTFDSFWAHTVYDVMEKKLPSNPNFSRKWTEAMEPGANPPVDEFKFLRHIPAWMVFWKRRALSAEKSMTSTWVKARGIVDQRRAEGDHRASIADTVLDDYEKNGFPMTQHSVNNMLGELVQGGADTTASHLLTLILAFAKHPDVQKKAQKQLDRVCGVKRTPVWDDFAELPYINSIIKEGMRWRPAGVTGVPHRTREDDYYKGMFIPKDTTVFIGIWAIHHTNSNYSEPEKFDPERYEGFNKLANDYAGSSDWKGRDKHTPFCCVLHDETENIHHYGYGAGRRICPGIHAAERNMWRIAAKLLWAFEFAEPLDPVTGQVQPLDDEAYQYGILQSPLPFRVRVKVRSEVHAAVIKAELNDAMECLSKYS
ncbi:Cytochrome P450 monooxygenase [Lachnellula occidentalis]|uniref:Cytochrome P450 monooxygenase n=1 Tax=Lachnellula occidentalis TaxID=215460 RepID=A0A8H8RGJ5_9HELO|nr:Cytochrome P450 monooxygenase [Lachnellula occidentalis]